MPPRPIRVAASLLACVGAVVAADGYTYNDLADGSDIQEGIYGSHGGGEFDKWRLHLGLAPALDRIRLSTEINDAPYPGPSGSETDRVMNDPVLAPQIGLTWLLGDFDGPDHGWFYTLGIEYTQRSDKIIYESGTSSVPLDLYTLTAQIGMGYA